MSEAILNTSSISMYDEVPEITQLNKVDGFDPKKYMRIISAEGEPVKYYLDVAFRKLWFRLKHPTGKIVKKILKLDEQVAIVEARVYLDRNDPDNNFISNALAQRYKTTDTQFGMKYVELAETAAVGRALSDAGFGLQFADQEKDLDPDITEAPMESQIIQGLSLTPDNGGEAVAPVPGEFSDESIPGQFGMEAYIPMPDEVGRALQQGTPHTLPQTTPPSVNYTKDMPVEEIYKRLTYKDATAIVVSVGVHKGKTLGQIAMEKPKSLEWYVNTYAGPDNILRAASKFLIDQALAPAS